MKPGCFVYIIKSQSSGKIYTGLTTYIDKRLREHNWHISSVKTTKIRSDYELIFCSWFETRAEARLIERYMKSGSGREFRDNLVE